jgi:hypothetical protein
MKEAKFFISCTNLLFSYKFEEEEDDDDDDSGKEAMLAYKMNTIVKRKTTKPKNIILKSPRRDG